MFVPALDVQTETLFRVRLGVCKLVLMGSGPSVLARVVQMETLKYVLMEGLKLV